MADETTQTTTDQTTTAPAKTQNKGVDPRIAKAKEIKNSIIFKPLTINFWPGRELPVEGGFRTIQPEFIVDHMTGGVSLPGDWFASEEARVSAHFAIDRDGTIEQYVQLADTAWANGPVNQPNGTWDQLLMDIIDNQWNPNYFTISIEHVSIGQQGFTAEQIVSSINLHWYLCYGHNLLSDYKLNIPPVRSRIIRHSDLDSVTRGGCPGPFFPMQTVLDGITRLNDQLTTNP